VTAKLADLLTLERIERDLYRAPVTADEHRWLYGGQVAAQALAAAGDTVDPERVPHSLHGYFLRGGDAARPTVLRVERDRDGGSFSARRVVPPAAAGGRGWYTGTIHAVGGVLGASLAQEALFGRGRT
jgi:acyl-CoA thioesterase